MTYIPHLDSREEAVGYFNVAAGNKQYHEGGDILPHASCFAEELAEFSQAMAAYMDGTGTRAELVKEYCDAVVTLSNLGWFFDIPGDEAFDIVHNNNMSKLTDGVLLKDANGKVLKPEGYQKPDLGGL